MKTSCIQHGAEETFVMIRRPYMELVGGNACAAALLSVFENWTNTRLRHREQAEAINRQDKKAKRPQAQDTGLWIFRTKPQLIEKDLCGAFGRAAFDKAIELLVSLKLIERRENPDNPRDRTLQYRLDVVRVNGLLEQKRNSAFGEAETDSCKSGNQPLLDGEETPKQNEVPPVGPPNQKIGGKELTDEERVLAAEVLAAFNAEAGTSYKPDSIDHLRPIVGRIREFPELGVGEHRGIIAACFAKDRWWKGTPAPRVIYGNRGQFESSIETWRAAGSELGSRPTLRLVDPVDLERARAGRVAIEPVWAMAREGLRAAVPESTWRLWLEPIELYGADGDEVLVSAPPGKRGWTEKRYGGLIEEALSSVANRPMKASFAAPHPDEEGEAAA